MRNVFKVIVGVFLLFFAFNSYNAYSGELKLGFVNYKKVFNSYEKTKDLREKLKEKTNEKKLEAQKMIDDINKLKNQMQILSEDAKEEKRKELKEKLRKFNDFSEDAKEELLKESDKVYKQLSKEIVNAIQELGKKGGYTFIFDSQTLFYKDNAYDLTDAVIKFLNDKYKKEKSKNSK